MTDADIPPPSPSAPSPPSRPPRARAEPLLSSEIAASLRNPLQLVDLVLATPERLAANLESASAGPALALAFVVAATLFAVPYGLVISWDSWWRIAALYLGSTLICLPSLYVFARYVGVRVGPLQIAVLAATVPAVAAMFTFGFAPVLAFLRATMESESATISWLDLSQILLAIALVAGIGRLWRCILFARGLDTRQPLVLVLLGWHGVFLHVLLRMADVLGLRG